jgi:hypothetical protein
MMSLNAHDVSANSNPPIYTLQQTYIRKQSYSLSFFEYFMAPALTGRNDAIPT